MKMIQFCLLKHIVTRKFTESLPFEYKYLEFASIYYHSFKCSPNRMIWNGTGSVVL